MAGVKDAVAHGGRRRAFVQSAICGYLDAIILIVQGLVLVPLYVRSIGLHLYGLWLATGGVLALLTVLNLGFGNFLVQRIANAFAVNDVQKFGDTFINGLAVYFGLSVLFLGLGTSLSIILPFIFPDAHADTAILQSCLQVAVIATAISLINECMRGLFAALLQPLYAGISLTLARLVGFSTTYIGLQSGLGLWAIPLGMLAVELICFTLLGSRVIVLLQMIGAKWRINLDEIKIFIRHGALLLSSRLVNGLSRDADPILITVLLRPEITSVYIIARRAADIVFQMMMVLIASMHAPFSQLAGGGDDHKTIVFMRRIIVALSSLALIGSASFVALNSAFVALWVGSEIVMPSSVIVLAIGISYFLNVNRNMAINLLNGIGEFNVSSKIVMVEGIIKIPLAIGLVQSVGLIGIPLAHAVCCGSSLVISLINLHRLRPSLFGRRVSMLRYGFGGIVMFGAGLAISQNIVLSNWTQFAVSAFACVLTGGLALAAINPFLRNLVNLKRRG
jgi:O-antigen/teichoic acid export membrane protein